MLYIDTKNINKNTCGFYFGLEEYLIKDFQSEKDVFLLWDVDPTVMIGRHQVTDLEIDKDYIKSNDIKVVRRNSGGGAVYTDHGCFQFSFITNKTSHNDIFENHVHHIVDSVKKLGLNASFTGRNDILVDGRKFSGNAEYIYKDKMVIHGTILIESNLDHLIGSLTPDKSKLNKHAISSVKSRVINIGEKLNMSIDKFYNYLVHEIKTDELSVADLDMDKITEYSKKFETKEWNFGKNPKYEYKHSQRFDAGCFTVYAEIKKNVVTNLTITGDFFSLKKIQDFENAFIGVEFTRDAFLKVTKSNKVRDYFYKLKTKEFLELFFGVYERNMIHKPDYLKIDLSDLNRQTKQIRALLKQNNLHTVCQEASCPNQLECFSNKTATFMILGAKCTRNCKFCDVEHGTPLSPDIDEPAHLVNAVKVMGLKHIVITSVTRDDLDDYGSKQFVKVINALKKDVPDTTIEVLIPDFMGDFESIKRVVDAKPDVINHNLETAKRLYKGFRDNADYDRSINLLKTVKDLNPSILTKSGIMLGIGEQESEIIELMRDLRAVDCDIMTIGQYLQPSKEHVDVVEYVTLEQFDFYKKEGIKLGFTYVASGPLVRSSYQAYKQFKGE